VLSVQDVASLLAEAAVARQRGDAADQRRLIESALAIDQANPHALNARGMWALGAGEPTDAAGWFYRAAQADPGEPALWMNLATAQRALGDEDGELASLERALAADQLHFMALVRKAELHQRCGRLATATQSWQAALAVSAGIDNIPPALAEALADARLFVERQMQAFGVAVDTGMAEMRAAAPAGGLRRIDACIDTALGRRKIYANECAGVHFPFLPADEFFDRGHFPWLPALEAKTDMIAAEFRALMAAGDEGLRPYVSMPPGTPPNKWTALSNRLDWGARFLWEYGKRIDTNCMRCPETVKALEAVPQTEIPGRAPTAFFSLLKPRTRIPPHTGVTNSRTIIHLPLIVPPGCGFRVGGETRAWKVGEALAFDDTIEHEAWNDSDELRVVLIFDVWNPHMTADECRMLRHFFEVSDASGHNPDAAIAS
jgi:aspartyl/asparaginyl beta-hydroxylase (cupin superfamily)/Flp pilus assembly protein TadD